MIERSYHTYICEIASKFQKFLMPYMASYVNVCKQGKKDGMHIKSGSEQCDEPPSLS